MMLMQTLQGPLKLASPPAEWERPLWLLRGHGEIRRRPRMAEERPPLIWGSGFEAVSLLNSAAAIWPEEAQLSSLSTIPRGRPLGRFWIQVRLREIGIWVTNGGPVAHRAG